MSSNYPKKPALRLSSTEEQTQKINAAALELVDKANSSFSGTRIVTKKAALTVVSRSLAKNESDAFSVRKHKALTELSHYITLAQSNRSLTASLENTDLLPIAHPRSNRDNDLTLASLLQYRARWINDDPNITDETVKALLLSAFTSHPASVEYEYALTRLSTMPQGMVPQYALVAALGDGNSSLARRMRAMKQRRDRKGQFAEMGGGLRALIKRANGVVQSLTGVAVSQSIDGESFDMELPDGKIVRVPTGSAEGIKAILPSTRTKDGYSKTPAKVSTGDPVINEADLQIMDAPSGFELDETWSPIPEDVEYYGTKIDLGKKYTDDAYDVIKFDSPNASAKDKFEIAQQKEAEGQNIVTEGLGKDGWLDPNKPVYFVSRRDGKDKTFAAVQTWADVQDYISQDEPKYEKNEGVDPSKAQTAKAKAAEKKALLKKVKSGIEQVVDKKAKEEKSDAKVSEDKKDFDYPEGFYKIKKGEEYTPEGPIDGQVSPDYSDDPVEIAQKFETDQIVEALEKGVSGTKKQPATGFGVLPFEAGDEIIPAEALYNALKEKGEDADAILGNIYSGGKKATLPEVTPEVSEEVKDAIDKGDIEGTSNPEGDGDPATLPPLLEGLSEDEKAAYAESGDYAKYLPKNVTNEAPTGYTELNEDPFNNAEAVIPEDAPEGFTFNPVEIAKSYKQTGLLEKELRRSLEPGNEMPGYGIISQETPEGEDYIGYIPGEAIRDALQLQGVDTNALINSIYAEGVDSNPTPQEVQDALEGDTTETTEGTPSKQETPAETTEQTPSDEAGPEATTVNTGQPTGPARLKAKVSELKAGDVTTNDFFTIEKIYADADSESAKAGSVWVEGYYPGHATQKTKLWYPNTEIEVYRNVDAPQKGDLPELSKPYAKDYDPQKKVYKDDVLGIFVPKDAEARSKYLDDVDQYNARLTQAKAMWAAPEGLEEWQTPDAAPVHTPENPIGVSEVASVDVKAGDITFKKEGKNDFYEFFVVEGVSTDEEGNAVVQGYYPGHESQTKTWKGTTKIQVIKGATPPEAGTKPALERPKKDDPDFAEKKAAFDAAKKESAATWTAPIDLEAAAPKPKAKKPTPPAFQGEKLKAIAEAAGGDPKKFKELLSQEEVIHIDFESTGGFNKPSPIQVALVKTKNGEVVDSKVLFMNPEKPLDSFYTDKDPAEVLKDSEGNPITDAFLEKQMSQEDAFKQIMEFMGENPIVSAHNLPFDGEILKRYTDQFGMDYKPSGEIDTLSLARKVINGGNGDHVLQAVANRYDLADPNTDWHDAAVDVAVLPGILDNLLDEMAITKGGIDSLDIDKAKIDFDAANEQYLASKSKKSKADSELVMAKPFADGMAGKDVPTVEELGSALPKELPTSDELGPATTPKPTEVSDNDSQIESILGGLVSNNWVSENENTTNVGKIAVEDMKPGDFISAQFGGYHEIISVEPDPDNDKKMVVTRRLLANGKEYTSSWIKYQAYEVRRRNEPIEIEEPIAETPVETPEVEQPILETDESPEKESSAGTWNGYKVSQGTDGVYYAENISASDVQALRNGELTPPQLPFFAPLGGGNDQETGEGYFFSVNGKRFWGKYGAAGALVRRKNSDGVYEYFLAKRSSGLSQGGGKWGYPGGAHKDQTIAKSVGATAKEEFSEEVGGDLSSLEAKYVHQNFVGPEWAYDTYVFEVGPKQLNDLTPKDGENSETGWFTADQINQMAADGKLHTDFADSAQAIFDLSEDNTKGPEKPTPAESKSTEVKAFDTTNWKKIGGQAGSNEGAFYVDPDTGEQYYVKKPKSDKHAANEALASALYAEAGTKIGRVYLGKDSKGNTVLVSPLVENSNKDFKTKKSESDILKSAQEDFAVDAWLNNYDVVGLDYDNMLTVDKDVYRVDPGGALLFRAQGNDKKKDLTDDVKSIDTYRDPKINPQSADIFASMTDEQIAESAKKVQAISPEKIDQLVDQAFPDDQETANFLKEKLKARRQNLIDRFNLAETTPEPAEVAPESSPDSNTVKIDFAGNIDDQINAAIADGKKVSFFYNGSDRVVTPKDIWTNPKNGNVNLRAIDSDGVQKNFTISKMESNSEGFEIPTETPKPSTEAPSGWVKEGNYTWKKDGWVVTEDTDGNLTASKPEVSGMIFGTSWDEVQTKIDAEDTTPSIPKTATPEEIKAIAESPDGGITPSANDNIEPLNPVDTPLTETEKSTSLPEAEKQKVLDEVSNLAEKLFGSKGKTKDLLEALKGQEGVDNDLIDSIISDIDAPKTAPDATPEEKITSDLTQSLTPEDGDEDVPAEVLESVTTEELAAEAKTPMDPDLIWKKVQEEYSSTTLPNGHIVVFSQTNGTDKFDVVVKRNSDNTFSVYHRITGPDGTSKVKNLKGRWHSFTALKSRIENEKWKAKVTPSKVKAKAKTETPGSILPAALPTQKGSYVSADGVSVVKVGQKVRDIKTGKTGVVISLKDELITGKSKLKPEGYTYTDVAKVKWDDTGAKNWKVSTYLEILDGPGGSGGTEVTPTPTPSAPSAPSKPSSTPPLVPTAPPAEVPTYDAPSLQGAKALKDVEALAAAKNSNEHMSYFGADSYSDYKEFLKGDFVKDPESKNLVPGMIVSNASPNANDQDLTSHGVITKTNSKTGEVEVTYFDGPLAGKGQALKSDKVWSREKFLTNEQSKELGIDVDTTLLEKSRAASKAKGEKYAKELEEKKKKAQQEAEAKALKAKFEVNGPGFSLQTANAPADWSKSPVDNAPSLEDALKVAKGDDPLQAAKGVTVLADSDSIEDLELRVQKVTGKGGKEQIRVTFAVTDWAANSRVAAMIDDPNIAKSSGLDIDKYEIQPDGSLVRKKAWAGSDVDSYGTGVTYSGPAGKGTFKLHRAKSGAEKVNWFTYHSNSQNSVAFHNKAELLLPANATSEDIANALKEFGVIDSVRPATKDDIKGLVENKMIWLYGRNTDGTKNYAGELREKILQQIKDEWGFTAEDVEVSVDSIARGRIQYLVPESVADSLVSKTGANYFKHQWKSGGVPSSTQEKADFIFNVIMSGSLYSTVQRWTDGINVAGMSSRSDIKANGGNYVFTSPQSSNSNGSGSGLSFTFDGRKVLRRLDFYKNNSDNWGQLQSESEDVVDKLKNNYGEVMFKKNLSWADLSGISLDSATRKILIDRLTKAGVTDENLLDVLKKGGK